MWVEVFLAPLGWRTVIRTSVVIALLAGALVVSSKTKDAVSMRAVAANLVGLVQPDVRLIALANYELTTTANFCFRWSGGGFGVAGIEGAAPHCVGAGGSSLVPRFVQGACGAVVAGLDLVAVGPAVSHLA